MYHHTLAGNQNLTSCFGLERTPFFPVSLVVFTCAFIRSTEDTFTLRRFFAVLCSVEAKTVSVPSSAFGEVRFGIRGVEELSLGFLQVSDSPFGNFASTSIIRIISSRNWLEDDFEKLSLFVEEAVTILDLAALVFDDPREAASVGFTTSSVVFFFR